MCSNFLDALVFIYNLVFFVILHVIHNLNSLSHCYVSPTIHLGWASDYTFRLGDILNLHPTRDVFSYPIIHINLQITVSVKQYRNKCNVGYGFVNMTSPEATIRLYKAFHHQNWEVFNSKKICEVSYARLQVQLVPFHFFIIS